MSNLAYENLYDDRLREIINGRIVNMAPLPFDPHAVTAGNIYLIFGEYLRRKRCRVYKEDKYIRLDKIENITLPNNNKKDRLIPDVMVVCNQDINKSDGVYGAPDLVVEVLSPSTMKNDIGIKKDIYELIGVKEYWIVSPRERTITVYILKDGKYALDNVYVSYTEEELIMIAEDEEESKKEIIKEFKTTIFDDLTISTDDVFDKL